MDGTLMQTNESTVLGRMTSILDVVASRMDGPVTMSEVARESGLSTSTVHRMLGRMVQLGLLKRSGKAYRPGPRLAAWQVSPGAPELTSLAEALRSTLVDLQRFTGLTVHLTVLDGDELLYVDKLYDSRSAQVPSRVGHRVPATCTAAGKALMALKWMRDEEWSLDSTLHRSTQLSIVDPRDFEVELGQIHRRGVSSDNGELRPDLQCLAVAVSMRDVAIGAPDFALSVASNARMDTRAMTRPLLVAKQRAMQALLSSA